MVIDGDIGESSEVSSTQDGWCSQARITMTNSPAAPTPFDSRYVALDLWFNHVDFLLGKVELEPLEQLTKRLKIQNWRWITISINSHAL